MDELLGLPDLPTSVFVLLPASLAEDRFVVVIDKEKDRGRKLVGGGASKDRTIAISAAAEVFEEVGHLIHHPTDEVVEVHNVSTNPDSGVVSRHHWVAVKSLPPISDDAACRRWEQARAAKRIECDRVKVLASGDGEGADEAKNHLSRLELELEALLMDPPIALGDEIKSAWWETTEAMKEAVERKLFFTEHGRAIKWYLSGAWARARSLCGGDEAANDLLVKKALSEMILSDKRIVSWFIDTDGCLVFCYDPDCEVCERDDAPPVVWGEVVAAASAGISGNGAMAAAKPTPVSAPEVHVVQKPAPVAPAREKFSGKWKIAFVQSDRFGDNLLLLRDHEVSTSQGSAALDGRRYQNAMALCEVELEKPASAAEIAEMFGVAAERYAVVPGSAVFIAIRGEKKPAHSKFGEVFVSVCLNETPPADLLMNSVDADLLFGRNPKKVIGGISRFNRAYPQALWVHEEWFQLPKKDALKRKFAESERRDLVSA
ncbi:MAG: hypothetical protein HYW90_01920 [Candidatus Sungbacteria bacterium]|nr:hypothetical protein [Candidatus Sungbacteria bacterium]